MFKELSKFISKPQLSAIRATLKGEEAEYFEAKVKELTDLVNTMPRTYQTDGQGKAAVAYLHYFHAAGWDWYITERDMEVEQHQAFGWASPPDDHAEAGYISIEELMQNGAELDLYWEPKSIEALGL